MISSFINNSKFLKVNSKEEAKLNILGSPKAKKNNETPTPGFDEPEKDQ